MRQIADVREGAMVVSGKATPSDVFDGMLCVRYGGCGLGRQVANSPPIAGKMYRHNDFRFVLKKTPPDKMRSGINPLRAYPTSTIFYRKSSDKRGYCSIGLLRSQPPFHNSGRTGKLSLHNCRKSFNSGFPVTLL